MPRVDERSLRRLERSMTKQHEPLPLPPRPEGVLVVVKEGTQRRALERLVKPGVTVTTLNTNLAGSRFDRVVILVRGARALARVDDFRTLLRPGGKVEVP